MSKKGAVIAVASDQPYSITRYGIQAGTRRLVEHTRYVRESRTRRRIYDIIVPEGADPATAPLGFLIHPNSIVLEEANINEDILFDDFCFESENNSPMKDTDQDDAQGDNEELEADDKDRLLSTKMNGIEDDNGEEREYSGASKAANQNAVLCNNNVENGSEDHDLPNAKETPQRNVTYSVEPVTNRIVQRTDTEGEDFYIERTFAVNPPYGYDHNLLGNLIRPDSLVLDERKKKKSKVTKKIIRKRGNKAKRVQTQSMKISKKQKTSLDEVCKSKKGNHTCDDSGANDSTPENPNDGIPDTTEADACEETDRGFVNIGTKEPNESINRAVVTNTSKDSCCGLRNTIDHDGNTKEKQLDSGSNKNVDNHVPAILQMARKEGMKLEGLNQNSMAEIDKHPLLQPGNLSNGRIIYNSRYREIIREIVEKHRSNQHINTERNPTQPSDGNSESHDNSLSARMPPPIEHCDKSNEENGNVTTQGEATHIGPTENSNDLEDNRLVATMPRNENYVANNQENEGTPSQRDESVMRENLDLWRRSINDWNANVMNNYNNVTSEFADLQQRYKKRIKDLEEEIRTNNLQMTELNKEREGILARLQNVSSVATINGGGSEDNRQEKHKFETDLVSFTIKRYVQQAKSEANSERKKRKHMESRLKELEEYIKVLIRRLKQYGEKFPNDLESLFACTEAREGQSSEDTDDDGDGGENNNVRKGKKGKPKEDSNYTSE